MSQIQITDLTFSYDGSYDTVFDHLSLSLDTGWHLGLIGRNGRGKTTLLRLLQGQYEYRGRIASQVEFSYFPPIVNYPQDITIEILRQNNPNLPDWKLQREASLLELPEETLYRPFATLSQGEQTKAMLAALFLNDSCYPLIDEPTNHLDAAGRNVLARYLRKQKGFLLVSHDRAFLDQCVDHILALNRVGAEIQRGNFSSWYQNKQQQDHFEQAEQEKRKKEINRLEQAARRSSTWSNQVEASKYGSDVLDRGFIGHKAAKMMKRAKVMEQRREAAVAEKSRLLKNLETAAPLQIHPASFSGRTLFSLREVEISYDGTAACRNVSFSLSPGDRVALCGKNGTGKSSILKLVLGEPLSYRGSFQKPGRLVVSYVPQDTSFLQGRVAAYAGQCGIDKTLFQAILRKLDFSRSLFEQDMETFSAGQKKKVLLARSLCEQAHLYIWDEPLNFIDVFSRMQIRDLLLQYQPTMLFVEHDQAFTDEIATQKVLLSAL